MKHDPFLSLIAESFDYLFVVDKQGKLLFFPWGSNKPGYIITSKSTAEKAKKFYRTSFFICFVALGIAISLFHNFWGIIVAMVTFLGGWYLAYYLYTLSVTKHLLPAKASYKAIVLEKLESEDLTEKTSSAAPQVMKQWSIPVYARRNDPFLGMKRFWYRLSPAQLFLLFLFSGIFIAMMWMAYQPKGFGENKLDYLVGSLACILCGFSGFVAARNVESSKADLWGFLNWKLPMILIAVVFWTLAALSLYKFVVLIVT